MIYSHEVEMMCPVAQGANHGPAPIPEEAKWVQAKEIKDISGLTHGVGWCAPQQKLHAQLTLNDKDRVLQEALDLGSIRCSGSTFCHATLAEILQERRSLRSVKYRPYLRAINTHESFSPQIIYRRTQSAFPRDGLPINF